ncbi:MAG: hypothetical protein R6W31_13845 [Bacteroidales bacterium]
MIMNKSGRTSILNLMLFLIVISIAPSLKAQSEAILTVLDSASFDAQLEFVQNRTRVYDGFRAIREDVFQKAKKNALDSLNKEKLEVARLNSELSEREFQIESLNTNLSRTKTERDQAIRTKDSFVFLGMEVQKGAYNTVMWVIVLGLLTGGVFIFLLFKRSYVVTNHTKNELKIIQEEFEEYRKSSREKYEKLVISHHNDIMKMKKS